MVAVVQVVGEGNDDDDDGNDDDDEHHQQDEVKIDNVEKRTSNSSDAKNYKSDNNEEQKERGKEKLKEKENFKRKDYWLFEDIAVKVMNKKLSDGRFYKKNC